MITASTVPEEADLLCEGCGYTLNNLPTSGKCPECGKPIEESVGSHRHLSEFEDFPSAATFLSTTVAVIFSTRSFYRNLTTRDNTEAAATFSSMHLCLATLLFTLAGAGHAIWSYSPLIGPAIAVSVTIAGPILYLALVGLKRLATWLSAIEARYWGMRLPHLVVKRGLQFHTAHYLPVGLLAVTLVWGYQFLLAAKVLDRSWDVKYLTALCIAVVASAGYLFQTYWIAMKSMMYANR